MFIISDIYNIFGNWLVWLTKPLHPDIILFTKLSRYRFYNLYTRIFQSYQSILFFFYVLYLYIIRRMVYSKTVFLKNKKTIWWVNVSLSYFSVSKWPKNHKQILNKRIQIINLSSKKKTIHRKNRWRNFNENIILTKYSIEKL